MRYLHLGFLCVFLMTMSSISFGQKDSNVNGNTRTISVDSKTLTSNNTNQAKAVLLLPESVHEKQEVVPAPPSARKKLELLIAQLYPNQQKNAGQLIDANVDNKSFWQETLDLCDKNDDCQMIETFLYKLD